MQHADRTHSKAAKAKARYQQRVVWLKNLLPLILGSPRHQGVMYQYNVETLLIAIAMEAGIKRDHQPVTRQLVIDALALAVDEGLVLMSEDEQDGLVACHLPTTEMYKLPAANRASQDAEPKTEDQTPRWTAYLADGTRISALDPDAAYIHAASAVGHDEPDTIEFPQGPGVRALLSRWADEFS